jgi:hypothetical protein
MVISSPARIKDKGGIRTQFASVIDISRRPARTPAFRHPRA